MKKAFLIFMALIFATGCGLFLHTLVISEDLASIVPCLLSFICMLLVVVLLCKKKRVYHIYEDYIVIEQKGKSEQHIRKNDVTSLKFTYDLYYDRSGHLLDLGKSLRRTDFSRNELVRVSFNIHKKRYRIEVDESNYSDIVLFFEGIERKESTNWVYYLLDSIRWH
ncbi:MAG: hypothetical protein E7267_01660 [Lachnospiraceae bacterium]|nr:hypothetical protein [Lachnospiraceae bacterium]